MQDKQLLRYSRQILLPQIGIEGQEKLAQSTVFIVGLGGLGAVVALYLAAAGVGHLRLADADAVELSNLQRQIIHTTPQLGRAKTASAQDRLHLLNPEVQTTVIKQHLGAEQLSTYAHQANIVADCSDNFTTRFAINTTCVQQGIPLVSGAALNFSGQIAVFQLNQTDSPCYHCLYPVQGEDQAENCSEAGILAPLVGVIGSLQAAEILKILLNRGAPLYGKLLLLDARTLVWRTLNILKDPACSTCRLKTE